MANFLERISQWGWKKGTEKQLSIIKQATRDIPMEHRMFQPNAFWIILMIFMILGFSGLALTYFGSFFYQLIESLTIGGPDTTNIGLAVYGFYLAWFIPAVLLGTTIMQLLLWIFPKIGNTYTGTDMVKAMALEEGDTQMQRAAEAYKLSKNVILEKTKFIDLTWVRKQGFINMAKGTLVTTLIFLPFMYLSVNTHVSKLEDNTLVHSRFFQLEAKEIIIEDIDMVSVKLTWEDDHLEPYYEVELNDGSSIDLWELGVGAPDLERVLEIAQYLDTQDIFHFLVPLPSMSSLNEKTRSEFQWFYQELKAL